jgi:hypothetical protein
MTVQQIPAPASGSPRRQTLLLKLIKLLAVLVAPVTMLIMVPLRLTRSLWNCRVLTGPWREYGGFTARGSIVALFYWTMALNFKRYGRRGVSREVSSGEFSLTKWLGHCLIPLYAYRSLGVIVVLIGMGSWWLGHLAWVESPFLSWALLICVIAGINSTLYSITFALQNYNALGWGLFSLGTWAVLHDSYALAAVLWLGISLMSPTVLIFAGAMTVSAAITLMSPLLLLTLIPAGVKSMLHLYNPFIRKNSDTEGAAFLARSIGLAPATARYLRPRSFAWFQVYYLLIYAQFAGVFFVRTRALPLLFLMAVLLFVVNFRVRRFADNQSVLLFAASAAITQALMRPDAWVVASLWILVAASPLFIHWDSDRKFLFDVPVFAPVPLDGALAGVDRFLGSVPEGARVLAAFPDPGNRYGRILGSFRVVSELVHYAATRRRINFMPDWWMVFDLNRVDAEQCWGTDPVSVVENLDRWSAGYAVVTVPAGAQVGAEWLSCGLVFVERLSWREILPAHPGERLMDGAPQDWLLLKR